MSLLGYRLVRWTGACPDALLVSYAAARAAINDTPNADADDEEWSPARVRDLEAVAACRGRDMRVTAVVDGPGGSRRLHSDAGVARASSLASVEDTTVIREHCGKRLAITLRRLP